jgi:GntR family transcriptional regulator of gluconate operon
MKVLVVGAGAQGHVVTWNLARCPEVTEILLGDIDEARAHAVADQVGGDKTRAVPLDAGDVGAVEKAATGARLVMNATIPEFNMAILEACLAAGVDYQDMATGTLVDKTIDEATLMQMELDDDFKKAGLTMLTCTGMDPGVSSTFAGNCYEDLDVCTDIHIRDYAVLKSPVSLQMWSVWTYYTDCATPPLTFQDGEYRRVAPFGLRESYDFPAPFGRGIVVAHDHEELSTLPRFLSRRFGDKGLRNVTFKLGFDEAALDADEAFVASGMAGKEPVDVKGVAVRPIDVYCATLPPNPPPEEMKRLVEAGEIEDYGVILCNAWGEKGGKPAKWSYSIFTPTIQWITERIPGATSVSYGTSTPAAVYSEFLLKGMVAQKGCVVPEILDRPVRDAFIEELGRRGLRVTRSFETQITSKCGGRWRARRPRETVDRMKPLATRRPLAEDAAERIREEILSGGLRQGERLIEAHIAEQLGISRGPLREAFKALRAEGLVVDVPNRGTFVVRLSSTDVREIFDLRAAIETHAARTLAQRAGKAQVRELRTLLERLEAAAASGDVRAVSRADLAFHEAVCRLSGNRRLHAVFTRDVPTMQALIKIDDQLYHSLADMAREHRPLLEAIETRAPEAAAAGFEAHIDQARDLVAEFIEALPDGD